MEALVGKWNFVSTDNFEAYLKHVGVGMMTRKIAANLKPVLDFKVDEGDKWTMTSTSTFKVIVTEFVLGQEFEETTADGRQMKTTFTFEDGKLVQSQKKIKDGDKDSRIERYVDADGNLVIVMESEGVVAKRVYEKAK
ncbi:hypothetical protein QR680_005655 [Steinernema hermaphroditum]|uniref:Cytosolic fatty-acid binding proteins domain-containing protein n=1 Tax=Steinernema hermaphroditum TaxID=289476 RepID=A0AA39HSW4_9BILA|nr:hypothetical protein QR680_005655 [Steinernema hermaphroditum]